MVRREAEAPGALRDLALRARIAAICLAVTWHRIDQARGISEFPSQPEAES